MQMNVFKSCYTVNSIVRGSNPDMGVNLDPTDKDFFLCRFW